MSESKKKGKKRGGKQNYFILKSSGYFERIQGKANAIEQYEQLKAELIERQQPFKIALLGSSTPADHIKKYGQ